MDVTEQVGQSSKTIHELEKAVKQAEQDKIDVQTALEEAEVPKTLRHDNKKQISTDKMEDILMYCK